ncbi:calcium-activated chloride channel regulator 1-like [Pteronotus mesoamericanus]|uniref:calcium-activated chloride channel regulator 1-like n=1 Tax=Pteronotus mesoamericanus TaxID=1884717 RepID=UPI0023EE0367|nr:calcium-activated chloride channel regulator 1-like [Pteronotus parnellii mesoamericanus]
MVHNLTVILVLALYLLPGVKGSMVNLNNNGYDGIVIAINPSVPEEENLIQNIKEMVTEASTYLFHATKRRFYFRSVSILIPVTWRSKSEYLMPRQESYDRADVIVANPYLKYGDDPYTLQYGQCGEKGQYIHFTPNFLLTNNLPVYGSRGRAFVHEWAHLRWGVFDEYNVDQPFYISRNNAVEATRCSTHITGVNVVFQKCQRGSCITKPCTRDSQTGLYEAKCTFIPVKSQKAKESIMFMQSLNSVTEFCTAKTHNTEAPNLQNKMCNRRSTWDVIKDSDDFQNVSPMRGKNLPPHPTFSLLRSKHRVVCLVLDKSGSMAAEDRLLRMNQAVELYLIQIIEVGSLVGLVTFDSSATIQNYLMEINNENAYQSITANLPLQANGGTSICEGLRKGFEVIIQSNQSTSGSEIILLTDGEDSEIRSCLEDVKRSGAIIHTIALGPSADRELETLSSMTGGLQLFANKDVNGLIDVFSRISSPSGNITQRAIQLESKAMTVTGSKWINGTVFVDGTIGSDTFFVVTWTIQKPEILLHDPKGKVYKTTAFKEDRLNVRSARLHIPDIAEKGSWTYSLLNNHRDSQTLTVTVTTRASSSTTLPVTATVHMSQNKAHYPSPVIVYARVSQGFLPVLGVHVTAIVEAENGPQVTLELWDNGAGADAVKNDGIYSRYFTEYHGNGRYSLKVRVQARKNMARLSLRQRPNQSLYVPGYVENGTVIPNPPRPKTKQDTAATGVGDFDRVASGDIITITDVPPGGSGTPILPPSKITDLKAKFKDNIQLSWTAPGSVLDRGRAHHYIIKISTHLRELEEGFDNVTLVNTSSLIPKEAGSRESFEFKPELSEIENGTSFFIAIQAINEANLTSTISNIAHATKFIPPQEPSARDLGTKVSAISLAVLGLAVILSIF